MSVRTLGITSGSQQTTKVLPERNEIDRGATGTAASINALTAAPRHGCEIKTRPCAMTVLVVDGKPV
jgi:hypothetical protein